MSLLEDAREYLRKTKEYCEGCGMQLIVHPSHQPQCRYSKRQAVMPQIVKALDAAGALLVAARRIQGHRPREIDVRGKPGEVVTACSDCDDVWPCDIAKLRDVSDPLWKILDPEAYRENELMHAYMDYVSEQNEAGVTVQHPPQQTGESRTAWFTRLLAAVGRMPADSRELDNVLDN